MHDAVKILVVDDLPDRLLVYRTILEQPGLEIVTAPSGQEALRRVLEHEFAVILLDVNMPGVDGFEAAALIRARRKSAHTPIIFATAHVDEVHALRGYAHGAVDYILTPVAPEILRTKVGVFVELHRLNRRALERAASDVARARTEQARLAAVLESAPDFVGLADEHGRIVHVNPAGRRMLGLEATDPLPPDIASIHPSWAAELLIGEAIPAAARDGAWMGEGALRAAGGGEAPVAEVIIGHKGADGAPTAYSIMARDIRERKAAEQAIAASESRYRSLVHSLPAAVYTCDADGRITLYNRAAAELWGREPALGEDRWCGSWKIYRPDGTPLPLDTCPMAIALREGHTVDGQEIIIERPDGSRRHVLPHPEPMFDSAGRLTGATNVLMDITHRRNVEEARAHLAAIVDSTDDAVISVSLAGVVLSWNSGAERLFGYTASEIVGRPVTMLLPEERQAEESGILARIRAGVKVEQFETVRVAKDGRRFHVSLTVSPMRGPQGDVIGASKIARDITERKRDEAELRRHRERLEDLVHQRTAELEATHARLRLTDRLAAIGTLAAGLGHDMGNLLMPMEARLSAMGSAPLTSDLREDVRAIGEACAYLRSLSRGLRLLAMGDDGAASAGEGVDITTWAKDVSPFLRHALRKGIELRIEAGDAPPVRMSPASLTQVVFNLVQNAGDAMRTRERGHVWVSAARDGRPDRVVLEVGDDGPGMSADVLRRCMEPFFTTKTRGISTGLGLALVRGAVMKAGGEVDIRSAPGEGVVVRLSLPCVEPESACAPARAEQTRARACVGVRDAQMRAFVCATLRSLDTEVVAGSWEDDPSATLLVLDDPADRWPALKERLRADPERRAVVFGADPGAPASERVSRLDARPSAAQVRAALALALDPVGTPA